MTNQERFEEHQRSIYTKPWLTRSPDGGYFDGATNRAWTAWCAAQEQPVDAHNPQLVTEGESLAALNAEWPAPVLRVPRHGLELHASYGRGLLETFTIQVVSTVPEGEALLVHQGRVLAKLVLS